MKKLKKGFTLTELVIVIAVIAILAAVLIPTFSGIIRRANINADTQTCRNMNARLNSNTDIDDMNDVVTALNSGEQKYNIATLNPTTEGYRFVCEIKNNSAQILFVDNNFDVVYPKAYDDEDGMQNWWLPINKSSELSSDVVNKGLNIFLTKSLTTTIKLTKLVDVQVAENVSYKGNLNIDTEATGTANIDGIFQGNVTIDAENATINQNGTANIINIKAVSGSTYNGNVVANKLVVGEDAKNIVLANNSCITTLSILDNYSDAITITNNGIISEVEVKGADDTTSSDDEDIDLPTNLNMDSSEGMLTTKNTISDSESNVVEQATSKDGEIANLQDLIKLQKAVNSGNSYKGVSLTLTNDINISSIADWTPIGIGNTGFAGTLDGGYDSDKSHKIIGLTMTTAKSSKGFVYKSSSASGGNAARVTASLGNRYAVGFFGGIQGGTVQNIVFEDVSINLSSKDVTNEYIYLGIVAGYLQESYTSANETIDAVINNVVVESGTVKTVSRVAGIVGWMDSGKIMSCTNKADITAGSYSTVLASYSNVGGIVCYIRSADANTTAIDSLATPATQIVRTILILDCINEGTLTANKNIGGIVATYNSSAYTGSTRVPGTIDFLISNCTNNGILNQSGSENAVLIGHIAGDVAHVSLVEDGKLLQTRSCSIGENADINLKDTTTNNAPAKFAINVDASTFAENK